MTASTSAAGIQAHGSVGSGAVRIDGVQSAVAERVSAAFDSGGRAGGAWILGGVTAAARRDHE